MSDEGLQKFTVLKRIEDVANNTAIIPILFILWVLRPVEGYLQRMEFIIFLIEKGLLFENLYLIFELLPLLIIIPLAFFRERVSAGINNAFIFLSTKEALEEFDEDGDGKLTKEESQGLFRTIMEDLDEEEKKDFDSSALFDKYDSDKDGKLDRDELTSMILELFCDLRNETPNKERSSDNEQVKADSGEDEMQKLDRLYNEGYLSKERYERLKQDLSR